MPMLRAIFPDGIAPVGRTNDDERELLNIRWGMPGPQFGGGAITTIRNTKSAHWRRWLNPASRWAAPRKPNPATLSELAAGATARLQLLYPPRLRRGLAAISSPRASVLLRCGKTTPMYRLIGESCREDGAGDPCCGDSCRCPVCLSRTPVSVRERQ